MDCNGPENFIATLQVRILFFYLAGFQVSKELNGFPDVEHRFNAFQWLLFICFCYLLVCFFSCHVVFLLSFVGQEQGNYDLHVFLQELSFINDSQAQPASAGTVKFFPHRCLELLEAIPAPIWRVGDGNSWSFSFAMKRQVSPQRKAELVEVLPSRLTSPEHLGDTNHFDSVLSYVEYAWNLALPPPLVSQLCLN